MRLSKFLIPLLITLVFSAVLHISTLVAQQDPCLGPSCKCLALAQIGLGSGGSPIVGTHPLDGGATNYVTGTAKISAASGYTTGRIDGVCNEVGCECAEKSCEFHYVLELSIDGWGNINPSTVSSLNWKWRNHGGNINFSSGLPVVITKAADFKFPCGSHDVTRKIKIVADYSVAGSSPEIVASLTALFECLDCPSGGIE